LSWYEIPAADLDRAKQFYSTLFNIEFETIDTGNHTMAFFPAASGMGGALVYGDGCVPSQSGPLLYLNASSNLDDILGPIDSSGGQILMGKTLIGEELGYYALILDSEGNRLALTSKT
jgi:predicted enzyme related to lactoylglutathione lyase